MAQKGGEQFSSSKAAELSVQSISSSAFSSSVLMKDRRNRNLQGGSLHHILPPLLFSTIISLGAASSLPGMEYDYGLYPKMVCTPIPANTNPDCFSGHGMNDHEHHRPSGDGPRGHGWWVLTILHLRETLVQQKETILDQQETIRELIAKLTLCEGSGRSVGGHDDHHAHHPHLHHPNPDPSHHTDPHYPLVGRRDLHHRATGTLAGRDNHNGPSSPEQVGRMLQALKERLENLQVSKGAVETEGRGGLDQ